MHKGVLCKIVSDKKESCILKYRDLVTIPKKT